jgi:hypothetical protein
VSGKHQVFEIRRLGLALVWTPEEVTLRNRKGCCRPAFYRRLIGRVRWTVVMAMYRFCPL